MASPLPPTPQVLLLKENLSRPTGVAYEQAEARLGLRQGADMGCRGSTLAHLVAFGLLWEQGGAHLGAESTPISSLRDLGACGVARARWRERWRMQCHLGCPTCTHRIVGAGGKQNVFVKLVMTQVVVA